MKQAMDSVFWTSKLKI